jgi:hypothetical protein
MIIFDLKCENGHKFEGWFKDSQAFNEQNEQRLVSCPVCSSSAVHINPSSMTIMGKDSRVAGKAKEKELSPAKALQLLHNYIDKNFDDVGNKFAEVALKIHCGEEEKRNIRGITTSQEEESLKEEGVQFFKIPLPKMNS